MPLVARQSSEDVQNGSGTTLFYWTLGKQQSTRRRFPMRNTTITPPAWVTESFETTSLDTTGSRQNTEWGGREYQPGDVEDPGIITVTGFLNASIGLPRGIRVYQIVYPMLLGYAKQARWQCKGFVTGPTYDAVAINTAMTTSVAIKLTGMGTILPALRRL